MIRKLFLITILLSQLTSCGTPPPTLAPISTNKANGKPVATIEFAVVESDFVLTSPAFEHGQAIPEKYSCKGDDISPPLFWVEPPEGTQSFALIVDDPDAPIGTWVHWVVFNIPGQVFELPENMPAGMEFDDVVTSFGNNSWNRADYGGPCPPSGTHHYFFKLYALDTILTLPEGVSKAGVLDAIQDHTLAIAELMGTFNK